MVATNKTCCKTRPTFVMLVGIPGSGKSTYANMRINEASTYTRYFSSDVIRGEIYGDENCQKDPGKVFDIMHSRTIEALKSGYDVIYDATNITRKNRKQILDKLPAYVEKECVIVWAPVDVCILRDSLRERTVGADVILNMLKRFEAPFFDEGFDSIFVHDPTRTEDSANTYYISCMEAMKLPHDNPHHSVDIAEHCKQCGDKLLAINLPQVVKFAGYVHDVGKPLTKTFTNMKGETTDIAHYYGHQSVGAWMSYGFLVGNITLAWLISTHMAPYINKKYYDSLDPLYKNWITELHDADVKAH